MKSRRQLIVPLIILIFIIAIGVAGYSVIEKWPLVEALYMVVITLSTVGYKEVGTLSQGGRLFTIGLIVFGVGTVAYTVGKLIELILEGQIGGLARRRRMEKEVKHMKNHYIVGGFGRVGHQVAEEFLKQKIPFVIIDQKPEIAKELDKSGIPYIVGGVSSEENLEAAGVKKAKGFVATADSDAENVLAILSARVMKPDIHIVARASSVESEGKMRRAGANRVISPYFIAGRRMASMILQPVACDFLDTVMHGEEVELRMKEMPIAKRSRLTGQTLGQAQIRQKSGVTILTIRKRDGKFVLHPTAKTAMEEGDKIVALGTEEQLQALERMA